MAKGGSFVYFRRSGRWFCFGQGSDVSSIVWKCVGQVEQMNNKGQVEQIEQQSEP